MRKKDTGRYRMSVEAASRITPRQRAELARLSKLSDSMIDTSDIPRLNEKFWKNAVRNPFFKPVKKQLTVRLDADVLAWLKSGGPGYQTKLNGILRRAMLKGAAKG